MVTQIGFAICYYEKGYSILDVNGQSGVARYAVDLRAITLVSMVPSINTSKWKSTGICHYQREQRKEMSS